MKRLSRRATLTTATAATTALIAPLAAHAAQQTSEHAMVATVAPGWSNTPIFTIGETVKAYTPPGILDGIGVFAGTGRGVFRAVANHELRDGLGYPYALANGTELTGARLTTFEIQSRTLKVIRAKPSFDTIYDADGAVVTDPEQVNPQNVGEGGIGRLCSGRSISAGTYGFVDDIHLAGEEQDNGALFALDVRSRKLWTVPDTGLMAYENVTPVDTGTDTHVALLIGDDREAAPLWLYVGEKIGGSFLGRNGLAGGQLYAWVADAAGVDSPAEFSGTGTVQGGTWVEVDARNADGSLRTTAELDAAADAVDHFAFSRPEDVHDNPDDARQVVLASTGRTSWDGASDRYGSTYLVDLSFSAGGEPIGAVLTILYDGDDAYATVGPDAMLRSPDNLTWASDGYIYVQEDRATSADWGTEEASIWKLDPATPGWAQRVAQVDRSAVPAGQTDTSAGDLGAWETSGIVDVTHLVKTDASVALLYDVQAHGLQGGPIDGLGLVEGGQLALLEYRD